MATREVELNEEAVKRWRLALMGLEEICKLLTPSIASIMSEFHKKLLSGITKDCQDCTNEDLARHNWTSVPGCKEVHDILLKAVTKEHTQPNIPWSNTDVKLWTQLYWEVAKIYMQRGIEKTNKGPEDTDIANMLTMMDHCEWFRTGKVVKNRQRIQQVLEVRNKMFHKNRYTLNEDEMKDFFEKMLALLQDEFLRIMPNAGTCTATLKQIKESNVAIPGTDDWAKEIDSLSEEEAKKLLKWVLVAAREAPDALENVGLPKERLQALRDLQNKSNNTE